MIPEDRLSIPTLTEALGADYARIALQHVTREYPNKLDHVLSEPDDAQTPRALHPVFYGSLDWHSCVHGYWLLARVRRLFPGGHAAREIEALFAARLTAGAVAGERGYLARPFSGGFERPYGWAWLLMLAAELLRAKAPEAEMLLPLAQDFAARFQAWLPKATYPIRSGTHANTAFALTLALEYATLAPDPALAAAVRAKAWEWYGADRDCQAWEPSGEDFLSAALMEAACMRRTLSASAFRPWFDRFLPRLAAGEPATLFHPVVTSDRSDGKIVHLDGLNLSRAWCWRMLATALPARDPRRKDALEAARLHLEASLAHVCGDYMGEHWLASFAMLALDPALDHAHIEVEAVSYPTSEVTALVSELELVLAAEYPPEQRHGLKLEAIFQPHIRFFVAWLDGEAVGCGGVALFAEFAEVKRMYVRETVRGGVAEAIVARLEDEARQAGLAVLRLETGDRQLAAMRFYERAGFARCAAFGDYAAMPASAIATSRFYEKGLMPI